jgi:hypothetical protein
VIESGVRSVAGADEAKLIATMATAGRNAVSRRTVFSSSLATDNELRRCFVAPLFPSSCEGMAGLQK